jgi:hypothetical protein
MGGAMKLSRISIANCGTTSGISPAHHKRGYRRVSYFFAGMPNFRN